MVAAKNAVARPMTATVSIAMGACVNSAADRARHINAGGHHGGGVDESGNRRGTGHRVRQPDVQRDLRRFAGSADQQQQTDGGENADARFVRHVPGGSRRLG